MWRLGWQGKKRDSIGAILSQFTPLLQQRIARANEPGDGSPQVSGVEAVGGVRGPIGCSWHPRGDVLAVGGLY
jgi:hypothetical protein